MVVLAAAVTNDFKDFMLLTHCCLTRALPNPDGLVIRRATGDTL